MQKIAYLMGMLSTFIISTNGHAIETALMLNVADHFCCTEYNHWSNSHNGYHTGRDYTIDIDSDLESITFGKIKFKHIMPATQICVGTACTTRHPDHGMGNILEIEYLLNNNELVTASFNHLNSFLNYSVVENYVVAKEVVAKSGASGQESNTYYATPHLHFEMKKHPRSGTITAPWGYTGGDCRNYTNSICPSWRPEGLPGAHDYLAPGTYLNNPNKNVLLPFLSTSNRFPSKNNYDVYSISGAKIYGYLNINGTGLERVGILARKSLSRNDATNVNATASHKWLLNSTMDFTDLYGNSAEYTAGNYLFVPYAKHPTTDANYGYPVKFSVIDEGGIIVDNDQINHGKYKYESDTGKSNKIPGYFLTAELHNGRSNDTAHWYPGVAGNYKIFVHIPEYGPTATSVVYKIKGNGVSSVLTDPINMASHLGQWVELKSNGESSFKFTESGVVAIRLSSEQGATNYNIVNNQTVAFDAVKFIKIIDISHAISILLNNSDSEPSTSLVAANNIVSGNVRFEDQDGSKLPLPDNAWIRIVPAANQVEGNYDGINCKIIPSSFNSSYSGSWGQLFCYVRSQDTLNYFNDHSEKFQIVIYEQTQNQGEDGWAHWDKEEFAYCGYNSPEEPDGNLQPYGAWTAHTCVNNDPNVTETGGNDRDALTIPNGGETWTYGESRTIQWLTQYINGSTVDLYVLHDDPSGLLDKNNPNIGYIINRKQWYRFDHSVANTGSYTVDPQQLNGLGNAYMVLVVSESDNSKYDLSDATFTLSN